MTSRLSPAELAGLVARVRNALDDSWPHYVDIRALCATVEALQRDTECWRTIAPMLRVVCYVEGDGFALNLPVLNDENWGEGLHEPTKAELLARYLSPNPLVPIAAARATPKTETEPNE